MKMHGTKALIAVAWSSVGERDPLKLAALADRRVKSSREEIARALVGDYRAEHLFMLKTAYELYDYYESKITVCDEQMTLELDRLPDRVDPQLRPLPSKAKTRKSTPRCEQDSIVNSGWI